MRNRTYNTVCMMLALVVTLSGANVRGESSVDLSSEVSREYQVKAAFIYNFMKFTQWPENKEAGELRANSKSEAMVIGVIGKDPFGKAFDPILSKTVGGRNILIKRSVGVSEYKEKSGSKQKYKEKYAAQYADDLKKCHVLFICSSENGFLKDILRMIDGNAVLIIGEGGDFIDKGGMITFVMGQEKGQAGKLRFEVNLDNVKKTGISISSKLLKLARRIIKDDDNK